MLSFDEFKNNTYIYTYIKDKTKKHTQSNTHHREETTMEHKYTAPTIKSIEQQNSLQFREKKRKTFYRSLENTIHF